MKKFLFSLSFLFSVFFSPVMVFAGSNNGDWISCRTYNYTSPDGYFAGWDQYWTGAYPEQALYLQSSNSGITVYVPFSYDPTVGRIWFLSTDGSFKKFPSGDHGYPYGASGAPSANDIQSGLVDFMGVASPGTPIIEPSGGNFWNLFSLNGKTLYYSYIDVTGLSRYEYLDNVDIKLSGSDNACTELYNKLVSMDWDTSSLDPDQIQSDLPMLTYQTNSKSFYKFPNTFDTKGTFSWDYTEYPIYSQNPTDFVMDLTASARLDGGGFLDLSNSENMPIDPNHSVVISNGGAIVSTNEYSFAYKDFGKLVYGTYGYNKFPLHENAQGMADGYCVYIRTRQLSTGKCSAWKIFSFQGGIFEPVGYAESDDGSLKPLKPNQQDPQNSSPLAPYTSDNSTSAQSDPSSSNFQGTDNYDPSTVIFNLKQTVSAIGELPSMLAQLVTFMPAWLVSLIFVSIGLVLIVGVVKLIIR